MMRQARWMGTCRVGGSVWVALVLLVAGLPGMAWPVPRIPPGAEPLPIYESHRCDPVGDEERFRTMPSYSHGEACLNEGRYADAIPYLERELAGGSLTGLVSLGLAYDGVGRVHDAAARWHEARRAFTDNGPQFDFDHPLRLESALFERRYAAALAALKEYFSVHEVPNAYACCPPGHPVTANYNLPTFQDYDLVDPFTQALEIAAKGNPGRGAELTSGLYRKGNGAAAFFGELRYARAIMLLTIGRREEARFELRLAARHATLMYKAPYPYPFQWSALAILERLWGGGAR